MNRAVTYLLAVGTGCFLLWWGIIPAFGHIETDFPNYYTASRMLLEGRDFDSLYNDTWFQAQMHRYGIDAAGKFSPFPPPTALIMIPFSGFEPLTAQRIWTAVNIILLAGFISLLSRLLGQSFLSAFILVGMSGLALANNFRFGQFYLVVSLSCAYAYLKLKEKRGDRAAIAIALTGIIKYFPFIFLVIPAIRREFRTLLICLLTISGAALITMHFMGMQVFSDFFNQAALNHASGDIQNPFSATFQSFGSLARRLFQYHAELNQEPIMNSSIAYFFCHYGATILVVILIVFGLFRTRYLKGNLAIDFQLILLAFGGLLASPATATYHGLLIVLPAGLLMLHSSADRSWNIFFALSYACIGFLPYSFFMQFEGKGYLSLLAYPRLWILTTIFAGSILYIEKLCKQVPTQHIPRTA